MAKITNAVLATKIDNLSEDVKNVTTDVKANTKFRQQAAGFVSGIVFIAGAVGSLLTMVISYLTKGGN